MRSIEELRQRSNGRCELCTSDNDTQAYEIPHTPDSYAGEGIWICNQCLKQIEKKEPLDGNHWRTLSDVMWSETPAVQVMAWRMLQRLKQESWAAELLDMLYLDDTVLEWAKAAGDQDDDGQVDLHRDSNGTILQEGDTVALTKSLDIKGSALHAKMGTVVKNIRLVDGNTAQIEGKIEGQVIVILTKYVRKQTS